MRLDKKIFPNVIDPKTEARLFLRMLLSESISKESKDRLVEMWNEDHKRREKKRNGNVV